MKIELTKLEEWDGTWYKVTVDYSTKYFRKLNEAEKYFDAMAAKATIPTVETVIKSIEI